MEYDFSVNEIVYTHNDFLIASKDYCTPTVPLKGQNADETLLGFVAKSFPEVLSVCGKNPWEGGALHRLDNATGGLVVFARTQDFYDRLMDYQEAGKFEKTYIADVDSGKTIKGEIKSYFRAFGPGRKMVKAETNPEKSDNGILYATNVTLLSDKRYECVITRGFRHQIRVHLASEGCPIKGDKLYNPDSAEPYMHLTCVKVSWPGFDFRIQL